MSVLERCPTYRESNKGSKEKQGPTLSVRFTEVSVKRELTVTNSGHLLRTNDGAAFSNWLSQSREDLSPLLGS